MGWTRDPIIHTC